jgi:hypothetical protein
MTGILHEAQYTFMTICRSFLLRIKKFQIKVVQKIKTYIYIKYIFF